MALSDPTSITTLGLNDITYTAGQEPWNKNLDQYSFDTKETETNNYIADWRKWHGIYRSIPEARSTIDVWCKWIVGPEISMDSKTRKITDRIRGNGKSTFRKILINGKRVSKICGDFYAEIIRDKAGRITNLKPINSGSIRIQSSKLGIIKVYEQVSTNQQLPISGKNQDPVVLQTFQPEEIFHISNDPIDDEIHGIPELEKTFNIMKWKHQSMGDIATVFHRYVFPILDIYAKTDDPTEIDHIETQFKKSFKNMDCRILPSGTIEKIERVSIPQFSTLDPLPWQKFLRSYWTETSNVPDIIRGKSDEVSLAAGKLNVFSFREKIIYEQIEYAEEIKSQLGLDLKFEAPPNLDVVIDNDAKAAINNDNKKEIKQTTNKQTSD